MLILAVSAWVSIAAAAGWIEHDIYEAWFGPLFKSGAITFLVGLAFAVLGRLGGVFRGAACARCRRPVARGQIYCADHLKASIDEARDELRARETRLRRAR